MNLILGFLPSIVGTALARPWQSNPLDPANMVDPFWACEKTALPQASGISASWFYPKALAGNTHPGASLPHGFVSVVAYSGAYPTGYGVNAHSTRGAPTSMLNERRFPPYQYTTTGFAHLQPSGTGSIGQYMNYAKVFPLVGVDAEEWVASGGTPAAGSTNNATWLDAQRTVIVGERARPGYVKHARL